MIRLVSAIHVVAGFTKCDEFTGYIFLTVSI